MSKTIYPSGCCSRRAHFAGSTSRTWTHHSRELVCAANLIGGVDAYHVNVYGQFKGIAPELIGAVHPRVAISGKGARKGADPQTWPLLRATPGLEDIWQDHYPAAGTKDTNPPAGFIAKLDPADEGSGSSSRRKRMERSQ